MKFSWFLVYIVLTLFLFSPDFLKIFHNKVIIYITRNWNNDTTESQKERKNCLMLMQEESKTLLSNVQ